MNQNFWTRNHARSVVRLPWLGTSMSPLHISDLDSLPGLSSATNLEAISRNWSSPKRRHGHCPNNPLLRLLYVHLWGFAEHLCCFRHNVVSNHIKTLPYRIIFSLLLLKEMIRAKDFYAFSRLINHLWAVEHFPDYFGMIKHCIDFNAILEHL